MITVELTAAIDAAGTLKTFYLSNKAFVTGAADTPANIAFEPALLDPGSIGLNAFSDGKTGGGTKLEVGEISIANINGQFDAWTDYGFDGRQCVVRIGTGGAYPSTFAVLINCTVDTIECTTKQVTVRLRDRQFIFSVQALTNTYAGSNTLPTGVEGTSADLKGKTKPKVYGSVFAIAPPMVNTSKLIYQVSDGTVAAISGVYDQGQPLIKGADYPTNATLQAAVVAGGYYATCLFEGYFRLGGSPSGQVTADVSQGLTDADRTVGQLLKQLAIAAGLAPAEISAADLMAIDAANSSPVGIYVDGNTTFASAMDDLASSIGAYYGFDGASILRMGVLTAPSGTAVFTVHDYDILPGFERKQPKDNGLPVWSVTVNHTKVYTVETSDLAGSVAADRRAFLGLQFRSETAPDATIKNKYLLAGTLVFNTLLTSAVAAATEALRQLGLYKVPRAIYTVPVPLETLTGVTWKLLDPVDLFTGRFSLANGKTFRLLGVRLELAANRAILSLWG